MNTPHPVLMQAYGTEDVYREKTAGSLMPLIGRIAAGLFVVHEMDASVRGPARAIEQAQVLNSQFAELERARLAPAVNGAKRTRAPMLIGPRDELPVGWDTGMVRLAHVAESCGRMMAKQAFAPPRVPAAGVLPKGMLKAPLIVGGGLLALHGMHRGLNALSTEPHTPRYGTRGHQLAMGTNEYGYPQLGTPLY